MPMYWADYLADTQHLSTEEHGAYLLLIAAYWRRGQGLPDDARWLANVCKVGRRRWQTLFPSVMEFFYHEDGLWKHKRLEKEILRSSGRLKSARAAGKAGGLAKSKLTTTTPTVEPIGPPFQGGGPIGSVGKEESWRLDDATVRARVEALGDGE